jgi:hypothetical protein
MVRAPMCTEAPPSFFPTISACPQVQPGPDVDPQLLNRFDHGGRAPNRVPRVVETGEKPVTRGVELLSPESPKLAADQRVMAREENSPSAIAHLGRDLR